MLFSAISREILNQDFRKFRYFVGYRLPCFHLLREKDFLEIFLKLCFFMVSFYDSLASVMSIN
ncbi:hypothetical protein T11_12550 [Trichinella zimbabwensis]|uniref:Uncharacterized protein n=1 Tax=Trichinella zimbabwensis TaxID=268475 RepID=A0A0V1GNU2_9BILA|nr:hypothetical protein T11_12550 [Trichinella zimbabwensis]